MCFKSIDKEMIDSSLLYVNANTSLSVRFLANHITDEIQRRRRDKIKQNYVLIN